MSAIGAGGGGSGSSSNIATSTSATMTSTTQQNKEQIIVKVSLVGDPSTGKTSLMVRYVESRFDQEYTETLGVNFLEKTISLPQTNVTLSIWDLGGDRSFLGMLPMICVDAVAVCFVFDLTSLPSLTSVKEWYKQVRGLNKGALCFLVGTKFDLFVELPVEVQASTVEQARKYAKAMKAPLVFCSSSYGINILKLFKLIFEKVFDLPVDVPQRHDIGEPLLEY